MSHTLERIEYEEVRDFLPPEAQKYLDNVQDNHGFRNYALNKFTRLLYTNEELRQHYNALKALGYTCKQAKRMKFLAPARLHNILDSKIRVIFEPPGPGERSSDRWLMTINTSDNGALNNYRNIDKGYIKANGGIKHETIKI